MHEFEIVTIWFCMIIAGMILAMLVPRIASESCDSGAAYDVCERISSHQRVCKPVSSMVPIESEA
jgi:hypothetical protein